jgi:hypothetical protein
MAKFLPIFPVSSQPWQEAVVAFRGLVDLVKLAHHECNNMVLVCKLARFTYGMGFPVLGRHENLNEATHECSKMEYANVPMTFSSPMAICVRQGGLVSLGKYRELPEDSCAKTPRAVTRFVFLADERNELPSRKSTALA